MTDPLKKSVIRTLDSERVMWALLREPAAPRAEDDDLDILVGVRDRPRLGAVLRPLGFARVRTLGRGSHAFFVAYNREHRAWCRIDFVSELSFGPFFELKTGAAAPFLARRQGTSPTRLATNDAFWALLFHCLLDKKGVADDRTEQLRQLAQRADGDNELARLVESGAKPGLDVERLIAASRAGDREELGLLAPILAARLHDLQRTGASVRRQGRRVLRGLEPHVIGVRGGGVTVALLAPDGAGKSTLAARLTTAPVPVRNVYMGLYRPSRTDRLPAVGLTRRLLAAWRAYAFGRVQSLLGRVIVFDRYTHDAMLVSSEPLGRLARLHHRLVSRSCPAPTLAVVLDAPGAVLHDRKRESDVATLERQRQRYLELGRSDPRIVVLDANRPIDVVEHELTTLVWETYLEHSSRRIGGERSIQHL